MKTLFALLMASSTAFAQLSGIVQDGVKGKPVTGAKVFIDATSIFDHTDQNGNFSIEGVAPGFVNLVVYHKDYEIFKSSIRISVDKRFSLSLKLNPLSDAMKTSKVKKDKEYESNLNWFTQAIVGKSEFSNTCKIGNIKTLVLTSSGQELKASQSGPVIIENRGLGYNVECYLQSFRATSSKVDFVGALCFVPLDPQDDGERLIWERNREKAFWGSETHFYFSLINHNASQNGFTLFAENNSVVNLDSVASPGKLPGYFRLALKGNYKLVYTYESGLSGLTELDKTGQTTWLRFDGPFEVNQDGIPLTRIDPIVSGEWMQWGLSAKLPHNFFPATSLANEQLDWENFALLREKIYIHTDRDYYYPRENIWFKAYVGYSMAALVDTLSRVLYAELVAPNGKVLQKRICEVRAGRAFGDFRLPDTLSAGEYYLRSYTNWLRNYGDSTFFIKPIPILDFSKNLEYQPEPDVEQVNGLTLSIGKMRGQYGTRERVEATISLTEASGKQVKGNISLAVVDDYGSTPLNGISRITEPGALLVPKATGKSQYFESVQYFMERGISFRGRVLDEKGNPSVASIEIIQGNMDNLIFMETDEEGEFLVTGLQFYDSMNFAFKARGKKGKLMRNVEMVPAKDPVFVYEQPPINLKYRSENMAQKVQNSLLVDENTILLEEVTVKGKKIDESDVQKKSRVYGTADYSVSGDVLRTTVAGTNLLVGLQGKVPGLQVIESMDAGGLPIIQVRIRGGSSSFSSSTEPLILVDGVPFPDAKSVASIDPNQVDRVEVVTRAVAQFGSRGANGVIAIYTKSGVSSGSSNPDFVAHKVLGYHFPRQFVSPDYSLSSSEDKPDFRTTIYWRPQIELNPTGEISFYTSDLPGKYRMVIEGVTEDGKPFRFKKIFSVQ